MKLCEWDSDDDGTRDPNGCAGHASEKVDDNSGDEWALCAKHAAEARVINRELFFAMAANCRVFS